MKKLSNVSTAGGPIQAPGSANMPGAGYGTQTVGAGAASIPGMSVHCLACGKKIKEGTERCPVCGNSTKRVARADSQNGSSAQEAGETGGEASAAEQRDDAQSQEAAQDKLAAKIPKLTAANIKPLLLGIKGGAAMGLTGIALTKTVPMAKQIMSEQQLQEQQELAAKTAAAIGPRKRMGNPIQNIRVARNKRIQDALSWFVRKGG